MPSHLKVYFLSLFTSSYQHNIIVLFYYYFFFVIFQIDPKVVSKIEEEIKKFTLKAYRSKKFEYYSLTLMTKRIELSYKYMNNYDAFRFSDDAVIYMEKFISQLYGIEVKIPNAC